MNDDEMQKTNKQLDESRVGADTGAGVEAEGSENGSGSGWRRYEYGYRNGGMENRGRRGREEWEGVGAERLKKVSDS